MKKKFLFTLCVFSLIGHSIQGSNPEIPKSTGSSATKTEEDQTSAEWIQQQEEKRKVMVKGSEENRQQLEDANYSKDTRNQTTPYQTPEGSWGKNADEKRVNLKTLEGKTSKETISKDD